MKTISEDPLTEAWVTDVANYYGSISPHRLIEMLTKLNCPLPAVRMVTTFLDEWSSARVPGLPVGPEPSSVMGTAFLMPLDDALARNGHTYFRYTDDVVVVGRDLARDDLEGMVTETLAELHLERSAEKTHWFPPFFATQAVDDIILSYIHRGGRLQASAEELMSILEQEASAAQPDVKRLRFVLKGLSSVGESFASSTLCANMNLLNADPSNTCSYLAKTSLRSAVTRETLLHILELPPADEREALRFHALLAMRDSSWGSAEGRVFMAVACDERAPSATRAQAWMTAARTPAWRSREVMDAADAERHPAVRRAAVLTLRRAAPSHEKDAFLNKMTADPYACAAAKWAAA